jgi:uncharacterized protein (TIGR02001 family)
MNSIKLALCSAVATVAMGGAALAQDFTVTGNVGIVSDYVFRGISQTQEDPAIQGGVDVTSGIFYGGLWASSVDFGDSTDAEVDAYVGVKPEAAGFTFDLAAIYYGYVDQPGNPDWDYWEFKAGVSRAFGPLTLGGALYYSPDFTGEIGDAIYYEGNAAYAINDQWSVSGAIGYQTFDELPSDAEYATWNLGVSWAFAPHLTADLRYHDTEEDFKDLYGDNAKERLVLGIKAVFP